PVTKEEEKCEISSWSMRTRASGMAADLVGTHRILLAVLEIEETIKKIAKLLLKSSGCTNCIGYMYRNR
ncbi:unnamed protein product, partial [Urochloa humidicola]